MPSIATEAFIVLGLILLNGVFSMSELAVMSARKARLQQRADAGDKGARTALDLIESPNRFLSTVQVGITLIGILAGAFGGARLAAALAPTIELVPALVPYSQSIALGLVVLIITYLSLVLGELVPKRLALLNPERVAALVARPMHALATLVGPPVHILSLSTDLILRLLRVRPTDEPPVTEEEVKLMIEQGTEAGVFAAAEQDMVRGVFRLADKQVCDLLTPRLRIVWLNIDDPPDEHWRVIRQSDYSYFPVYEGSPDNVVGIVSVKDLWKQSLTGELVNARDALRPAIFVPESMLILSLLETFRESGQHLALVLDEYAGIQGLITLTDVMEAIVGDLPAPDATDAPIVQREDGSWLIDAMLPIEDVQAVVSLDDPPGYAKGDYQTLAGFVLSQLGRIPTAGEHFEWQGLRFEVMDMDGNRVDKVLVSPIASPTSA
ncbi:MAG: HlyC/CorC family transporter [Anaerolineae bacterium]|nr:HlyC/CorC family transporter [Anaerolineae bacterium]